MADRVTDLERIVTTLRERDLTIASCESLTGGLVGVALSQVPGSSRVYLGGLITYSSDLKVALAGVDAADVLRHGVINEQTAVAMARGALDRCGSDLAVACTGVAGPDGQGGAEPGTVWIALVQRGVGERVGVFKVLLTLVGDRTSIRQQTVDAIVAMLLRVLSPPTSQTHG